MNGVIHPPSKGIQGTDFYVTWGKLHKSYNQLDPLIKEKLRHICREMFGFHMVVGLTSVLVLLSLCVYFDVVRHGTKT